MNVAFSCLLIGESSGKVNKKTRQIWSLHFPVLFLAFQAASPVKLSCIPAVLPAYQSILILMWVQMHSGCEYSLGLCSCVCACICEGQIIQGCKYQVAPVDCELSIDEYYKHKKHAKTNIATHFITCIHDQTSSMVSTHILVFLKLWMLNIVWIVKGANFEDRGHQLYM